MTNDKLDELMIMSGLKFGHPFARSHLVTFAKLAQAAVFQGVDTNVEQVREKLLQRSIVGLSKYGVTTERTDLSDLQWLVHLHEEILDASVYLQRIINAQSHPNPAA